MHQGWLSGPVVWLTVHHKFRSIPCYHELTEGRLKCPYCGVILNTFVQGYMPWVSESGKPQCTALRHYSRDVLKGIEPWAAIIVRKGDTKFHPVVVSRAKGVEPYRVTDATARTDEQFENWLLRFWKEVPLIEFFGSQVTTPCEPQDGPKPVAPLRGDEMQRKTLALKYQNWLAGRTSKPTDDELESIADVIPLIERSVSANGTHRKPR